MANDILTFTKWGDRAVFFGCDTRHSYVLEEEDGTCHDIPMMCDGSENGVQCWFPNARREALKMQEECPNSRLFEERSYIQYIPKKGE